MSKEDFDDMPGLVDPKEEDSFAPPLDFTVKRLSTLKTPLYATAPLFFFASILVFLSLIGYMEVSPIWYVLNLTTGMFVYYIFQLIRKKPLSVSFFPMQNLILVGYEQVFSLFLT